MRFLFALSLTSVVTVLAQSRGRCIERPVPSVLKANVTTQIFDLGGARSQASNFTVDTYIHVITTSAKKNKYPRATIDKQMAALNKAYKPYKFQFTLKGLDYTTAYKKKLRKGTYRTLNIYLLSDLNGLLGIAEFPVAAPSAAQKVLDGVVAWAETVPGGKAKRKEGPYNLGYTAVHEAGHWLGLLHTFSQPQDGSQPSCDDKGDFVSDTPAQLTPTEGCPASKDTCPTKSGKDPINNYMDCSTNNCYTQFTAGQTTRMVYNYAQYRDGK
ncbi:Putative peptidase M43, pregnancy-associated plasma-A [Septoria linicola]|uniref:Peptidase M43, pregnancy-associated plasma-A n=1 Tax=Septoria linicola TaxID=215465 RepID=A0A9Q9AUM8_9PEZI|nr:Putative peptidase M43, pregnancy-associated plasma-A [Septoria linicola]